MEENKHLSDTSINPRMALFAKNLSEAIGVFVFLVGALVLIGWGFHITILTSIVPVFRPMSANAAVGLLFLGISLWSLQEKRSTKLMRGLGYCCAAFVFLLGFLTFTQYVFGWDLSIDQLLFKDVTGSVLIIYPGRMGFMATINFMLLGLALLFIDIRVRYNVCLSQILSIAVGSTSLITIIGYIDGVTLFYTGIAIYTAMALHLAISFFIFNFGISLVHPERGLTRVLLIDSFTGKTVRRLLPAAFILPLVFSWLVELVESMGLYTEKFDMVLSTSMVIIVFSLFTLLSAVLLERREEEKEKIGRDLFENEKRYHDLIGVMDEGYTIQDKNELLMFVSRRAREMLGYKSEEMIGKPAVSFFTKEDREIFKQQMVERRKGGSRGSYEIAWMRKNGKKLYTIITPSPILNEKGAFNGSVAVFTDITNRKMAEEKIKQEQLKSAALAKDLEKFKLAVDNESDHVMITDKEGIILYVNLAAEIITGYTAKETIGKNAGKLWGGNMPDNFYENMWRIIKEEKKSFAGELINYRKNGKPGAFVGEVVNNRKDGQPYTAEIKIVPILDSNGEVQFFVGIERDITKTKEIEQMKTDFISFVSHQLRTPLTIISWNAEMLRNDKRHKLSIDQKRYLTEVERGEKRMAALINGLLNVSRIETGRVKIDPSPTDMVEFISKLIGDLRPFAIAKNCAIIFHEPKQSFPIINVDKILLTQIVANLLNNATHYSKPGKCMVEVFLKEVDGFYQVDVVDKGVGIPVAAQSKIFTKFFRADNAVNVDTEGTGLGLYMSRLIIETCGGKIWFESTEGEGSAFHFTIPKSGMRGGEKVGFIIKKLIS